MLKFYIAALLLLCVAAFTNADLPVHCLFHQIEGQWELSLTRSGFSKDIVNTCTLNSTIQAESKVIISLQAPDVVRDTNGRNIGFWTLIYDQGFEAVFTLPNEKSPRKFFTFFNYTEDASGTVTSHCDRTFVGQYHTSEINSQDWGCFKGLKVNDNRNIALVNIHKNHAAILKSSEMQKRFKNDHNLIKQINSGKYGWTAQAYPHFEKMTHADINKLSGRVSSSLRQSALRSTQKFFKALQMKATQSPVTGKIDLPKNWDWRNVNGVNYVSPVRNQASCGSCYAFAATGMIEARWRIATQNKDQTIISPQDVVSCSTYSQGCDGGFQYLVSKYGEDFGFTSEQCVPYQAEDTTCPNACPYQKRLYTTKYQYVGGYYGAASEKAMMEEIYRYGPVVVGFQVYPDFRYYKGGVYRHTGLKSASAPEPQFYEVNHAVLAVGWGETDAGEKYWIIKNSWSDAWGMDGYFWIARGAGSGYGGECGVESDAVSAHPVKYL